MKAVITGAGSGIGREIAVYLSSKGFHTVLTGRNEQSLFNLSKQLSTSSTVEILDLTNKDSAEQLFYRHSDADIIVNCAGTGVFGEFDRTDMERELDMIDLNIKALHILTKLYYTEFVKRGSGRILNVASSAAYFVGPAFSSYYASKAYVHRLTRALSREAERCGYGVKLTLFCPGPVITNFGKEDGIAVGKGAVTAEFVARKAVDGMLKGKEIVFSDFLTGVLVFLSRILPEKTMSRLVYKQQLKKTNNIPFPLVKK